MCGIAGFYQTHFDYTTQPDYSLQLHRMRQQLLHRGPNDNEIWLAPHCGLAHTRLSIIDPARGRQPMHRLGCHLIYNGELYNAGQLRQKIKRSPKGASLDWSTDCDTEVLLNGYLAFGIKFFPMLTGIFAFALYDGGRDTLLLVRDQLGVKPLFFQKTPDSLYFGSEPKALFAAGIQPRLNEESWGEILGLGPARTPGHGVFADMKEVLPGHYLQLQGDTLTDHCYWSLTAMPHTDSYQDTLEKVTDLVTSSVRNQMVSDVPICTFLSGGLDSSLVSAICSEDLQKQGRQLATFSFDFQGNQENFQSNSFQSSLDRPFVDLMVSHLNSSHTYLECSSAQQTDALLDAVVARDLPCMADVESSMLYFCSRVVTQNKVALTGECADEIFGGYPWFHRRYLLEQNTFPWSYDMNARTCLLREDFLRSHDIAGYSQNAYEVSLAQTPALPGETPEEARRREVAWLSIRWFMATLLNRMDRTSMHSSLEARVPFADHRLLEYVYNIPWEIKCRDHVPKHLLIEVGQRYLPPEILYRKKSPYPKSYDTGYEKLLATKLREIIKKPDSPLLEIIDKKKLTTFMEAPKDYGRPWYGQLMAGPQMMAYLLQIDYWLERYQLL